MSSLTALESLRAYIHTLFLRPRGSWRKQRHAPRPRAVWLSRLEALEARDVPTVFNVGGPVADAANSVKLDAAGNEYVCGSFSGYPGAAGVPVDFDPGPGTVNLTNGDNTADAFVAKYSPTGQLLWVGQLANSSATSLTLDANGNVLVTGSYTGTVDFDFGSGNTSLTSGTYGLAYVAKYTADGGFVWADSLGAGPGLGAAGDVITTDDSGNVYSAGVFSRGTSDFDPGAGTFNLTNSSGNANTYISKLDAAGNFVWAKQFANDPTIAAGVWPEDIGVDANQRVYISGIYVGRADFDPSASTKWVSTVDIDFPHGDAYVAQLTAGGDLGYLVTMGSATGREDGNGIAVDAAGNAYVTGLYAGLMTIVPATGTGAQMSMSGGSDFYVMKLDPTGGLGWARHVGGTGFDDARSIALGPDGLYLTGDFVGTVDFDPNAGVQNVTGAGGPTDVFILKLATDSSFLDAWAVGGTQYEYGFDIAVNQEGAVGVVGEFVGSGDFEPGAGSTTLTSAGDYDAYVILMPGPNHAPVALNGTGSTDEDTPVNGNVFVTDEDGDSLTYAVVTGPSHGTLTMAPDGSFTYTPAANYNGPDSFTFRANDGKADSNTATVSITVKPVNDAPTLANATFSLPENSPAGTVVGTVTGDDVDGDSLTYSIVGGNTAGAFGINPSTGQITVANSAALDFETNPTFSLTVQVQDPGGLTGTGTVTINLTNVIEAAIDIFPGDATNTLSLRKQTTFEVAILWTPDINPSAIDLSSLRFGRTGTEDSLSRSRKTGIRYRWADVNGDGHLDLVVRVQTKKTGFQVGDTIGILTGRLLSGASFTAKDSISVKR